MRAHVVCQSYVEKLVVPRRKLLKFIEVYYIINKVRTTTKN